MTVRKWYCPRCGYEFEELSGVRLDCPRCGAHLYTSGIVVVNHREIRQRNKLLKKGKHNRIKQNL